MLTENKFSKYLLYAIGEIILVVIGILIALQINNWNENRKVQKQESEIYSELKSDLIQTRYDIQETISKHKDVLKLNQQLVYDIHNKKPYSDTIYISFTASGAEFKVIPKTSGFENLKNIGLNILSNDSLRISITNLYQLNLKRLEDNFGTENTSFNIQEQLFPYQNKYLFADYSEPKKQGFKYSDTITFYNLKIKDYNNFLTDNHLLKTLQLTLFARSLIVNEEAKSVEEINKVIKRIDDELKEI